MTKKQVGKRFLQIIIVLFGISFFTFGLTYLSPGDPAEIMLTECGNLPTPELLEQTRHDLGLDQPFLVQYGSWLKGVVTGDMGQSYSFKMPVTDKLVSCFWPTLKMSLLALLMMVIISIPLGILAAVYQNKFPDYFVRGITFVGVSVPSFCLGLSLGSLLGGTAVVEIIYNWPGMGNMAVKAISCRDYPLVQGYVLWIAILYMCINLLVDLSYTYLDPRLKEDR